MSGSEGGQVTGTQDKDYNLGGTNVSRGYDEQSVKVGIGVKF